MGTKGKRRWLLLCWVALLLIVAAGCSQSSNDNAPDAGTANGAAERGESAVGDKDLAAPDRGASMESEATSEPLPAPGSQPASGGAMLQPQAGLLTAGEWQDNAKWGDWLNLLNSLEGDSYMRQWSFFRFDRAVVSVAGQDGQPAVDAAVKLELNGQTVWEARTDVAGQAYVFAGLFQEQANREALHSVTVSYAGEVQKLDQIKLPLEQPLTVSFGAGAGEQELDAVDLMFVVDTTGSMSDELQYLEEELKDVIDQVRKQNEQVFDMRLSANFYRDEGDAYVVRPFPFTADVDQVISQIAAQHADGGGDYPEAIDAALEDAINEHDWRTEARARLLFLVLDAPPHNEPKVIQNLQALTAEAARQGIRIIPLASSGVDAQTEYMMRFIAAATGGTYLFLTDDSGIGNSHQKPSVGEYETDKLNSLLVKVINRYLQPAVEVEPGETPVEGQQEQLEPQVQPESQQ